MSLINRYNEIDVSQITLRPIVQRVARVAEQHAGNPAIKLAAGLALEAGIHFAAAHDGRQNAEVHRATLMSEGQQHTASTAGLLRVWRPLFGALLSFDASAFTPASDRPEDVTVTSRRLIAYVDAHGGASLPSEASEALGQLRASTDLSEARWSEARAALADVQVRSQEARDAAAAFHAALVVLRRVLVNVLGRSHHDYQSLRYSRVISEGAPAEIVDDAILTTPVAAPEGERESGEFAAAKAVAS